jgi:hypothetical protein
LGAQRCDLKALATRLTQELDRLKEGGEWRERLAEQCGKTLAAEALVRELRAALEWVAPHAYAGGKTFGQIEPVKSALAKSVEGEKSRQPPAALVAVSHQTTRL